MRLYLIPISTRRTLLYCKRLDLHQGVNSSNKTAEAKATASETARTWVDRASEKAARTWAAWEKREDRGWQKLTVEWGNKAFRKIPFEEWGLKSVPSLPKSRRQQPGKHVSKAETTPVDLVFPPSLVRTADATEALRRMGSEREGLHKRKLIWCLVGMPIVAPVALIPLVPNLPFFYLAYRAWSHWRAIEGAKHVQFLAAQKLLAPSPSFFLDSIYRGAAKPKMVPRRDSASETTAAAAGGKEDEEEGEQMLLTQKTGQTLAQGLDFPELEVELERAIWQVETALEKEEAGRVLTAEAKDSAEKDSHQTGTLATSRKG